MERVKNSCKNKKRSQMYNLMTVHRNTCSIEFKNIYIYIKVQIKYFASVFNFKICGVNFNRNGKIDEKSLIPKFLVDKKIYN